jgi:hypothetical protein
MARIDAYPRAQLVVGGLTKTVLEASATHGYRSPASGASATVRHTEGEFSGTEDVRLALGYRPQSTVRPRFGGVIDPNSIRWAPKKVAFSAVGPLSRAMEATGIEDLALANPDPELPPTGERYALGWINATDGTIVTDLLALCGITDVNIHDTGTLFATLAPATSSRYAVRLPSDQPPYQLIEEIDRITGCRTFDGPDGRVTRLPVSGLPGGTPARTFAEYVDFKDGASREWTNRGVYNKVTVTGQSGIDGDGVPYSISASRTKVSPYVPTPPGTREYTFHSALIETEALAGEVAARLLAELGRRQETITLPLSKGDSGLYAGMTVAVDSPEVLGVTASSLYRVAEVQDRFGGQGYQTTLILVGGAAAEGTDPNLAPVVAIDYTIELETTADGDPIAVVEFDSSGSYDPDGAIASRTWDGDPVAPTPIGDGVRAVAVYDPFSDSPAPTVSLVVLDTLGKAATGTREIVATADNAYTRELWIAEGDKLAHTADQIDYDEFAVAAVVIPEESGDEYQLAATAAGAASHVAGDGTITAVGALDSVTALTISRDPNGVETGIAWAAADDGRVWRSVDYGVSWVAVAPLPNGGACHAIAESPYAGGDVYAAGGHILYHSYDAGASWQAFYTHPDPLLVIKRLAAGIAPGATDDPADDRSLMWLGGSGGLLVERGGSLVKTFPAAETPDITGLTMSLDAARIIVATGDDRLWVGASDTAGEMTLVGMFPALGDVLHLIRDGRFPVAWLASTTGTWKLVGEVGPPIPVRAEPSWMVAYGRLVKVPTPIVFTVVSTEGVDEVITLWNGASNDPEPAGWQYSGFAGFALAAHVPARQANADSAVPGARAVAPASMVPNDSSQPSGQITLYRRTFDLPAGTIASATLTLTIDPAGPLDAVWLNGVAVVLSGTTASDAAIIPLLAPGATNLLAIRLKGNVPGPYWQAHKLEVGP